MLICAPPTITFEAKIAWSVLKPAIPLMSSVATLPVISLVIAMLRP